MVAEDAKAGEAATDRDQWYGEAADVATTPAQRKRVYRIHPAIGVARVGNAPDEYFIGPETEAFKTPERFFTLPSDKTKMPVETLISASAQKTVYKDKKGKKPGALADQGRIRRQAARFRIIEYTRMKDGSMKWTREITSDEAKIEWTVEVANKKAAFYNFNGHTLGYRAGDEPGSVSNPKKRKGDVITPGAKTITIAHGFNPATDSASRVELKDAGKSLEYLGELLHDDKGRLVFVGGRGEAKGPNGEIGHYANNDDWVDDVSDGHISATIEFPGENPVRTSDNGNTKLNGDAWVIVGPPDFAPELTNVTSMYDLMMDIAVRHLKPKLMTRTVFDMHGVSDRAKKKYQPHFEYDLLRLFEATYQTATVFVPANPQVKHPAVYRLARNAHLDDPVESPADLKAGLAPKHHLRYKIFNTLRPANKKRERDPGDAELTSGFTLPPKLNAKLDPAENKAELDRYAKYRWTMPMLWGDSSRDGDYENTRYALTETQYRFVKAWFDGKFTDTASTSFAGIPRSTAITPRGLDRAALERCVGGPFFPGIEASWLTRSAQIYSEPFRVKRGKRVTKEITFGAFKSVGVTSAGLKVGPGFFNQQMAQPWHADFYDCARRPDARRLVSRRIGWWPAQRPDDVVRGDPKAANLTGFANPVTVPSTAFKLPDPALGVPAFKPSGAAELALVARNVTITVSGASPIESPPGAVVIGKDETGQPLTDPIKLPKTAGTTEGKELFHTVTEVRFDAPEDLDATVSIGFAAAGGLLEEASALEGPAGVKAAGRTVTSFDKAGVASLKKTPRQILFTVGGAMPTESPSTVAIQGKDHKGKKITETVVLPGATGKASSTAKLASIANVTYAKGNAPALLGAKVQIGFGEFLGGMQPWDDGVNSMKDNTEKWWRLGFVVNGVETERDPTL